MIISGFFYFNPEKWTLEEILAILFPSLRASNLPGPYVQLYHRKTGQVVGYVVRKGVLAIYNR